MLRAEDRVKGCMTKNLVDDMVNIMRTRRQLGHITYATCKKWCNIAQWKQDIKPVQM